jgi:hypothetical protein
VFLINSRLGRFTATPVSSQSKSVHRQGHSFSRSYGVNMPSSLTIVLPIALVFSTRPPVSVLVRAPEILPRGFYMKHGITDFTHSLRRHASSLMMSGFAYSSDYALSRGRPEPRPAILLRCPFGNNDSQMVQECLPVVHRLRLSASP